MPGQFDEDTVMLSLFPPGFRGFMVDVGAYDPVFISNSWALEQKGWQVLCIEANPHLEDKLKEKRANVLMVACGKENIDEHPFEVYTMKPGAIVNDVIHEGAITGLQATSEKQKEIIKERWWQYQKHRDLITNYEIIKVPVRTLDWCLEEVGWETPVHVVSIDVEGTEEDVLAGFDIDKWQPVVFCLENWWKDDRFEKYLAPFGFELVMKTGDEMNEIYMHKERMKVLHELSS